MNDTYFFPYFTGNLAKIPEKKSIIKNAKGCSYETNIEFSLNFKEGQNLLFNVTQEENKALNSPVLVVRKDKDGRLYIQEEKQLNKQVKHSHTP